MRPLGNSWTFASSTAASPTRTRSSASALFAAPMSIHRSVIFETLSKSSRFIRWTACLPITPRTDSLDPVITTRWPTSTCESHPPMPAKYR
jgi:hypothetical protein